MTPSLTNADKRQAAEIVLDDDEWSVLSDREIAKHCGCSHFFVGKIRKEAEVESNSKMTLASKIGTIFVEGVNGLQNSLAS